MNQGRVARVSLMLHIHAERDYERRVGLKLMHSCLLRLSVWSCHKSRIGSYGCRGELEGWLTSDAVGAVTKDVLLTMVEDAKKV